MSSGFAVKSRVREKVELVDALPAPLIDPLNWQALIDTHHIYIGKSLGSAGCSQAYLSLTNRLFEIANDYATIKSVEPDVFYFSSKGDHVILEAKNFKHDSTPPDEEPLADTTFDGIYSGRIDYEVISESVDTFAIEALPQWQPYLDSDSLLIDADDE